MNKTFKNGKLQIDNQIDGKVKIDSMVNGRVGISPSPIISGTKDHDKLENREIANQHPISAITDLQETLDAKMNISDFDIIDCGTSTEVI